MKKLILLLFVPLISFSQIDDGWTKNEISIADVARKINNISDFEKDIILYHNLVRMYPKKYLELEILNWREDIYPKDTLKFDFVWEETNLNSSYYKSLVKTLKKQRKLSRLEFNRQLYEDALCLAEEQSKNGKVGHKRYRCKKINYWENCDYGSYNGRDVVNSLLVDENVKNLGHRKTILNPNISIIGGAVSSHPKYETVIVVDYCNKNCNIK